MDLQTRIPVSWDDGTEENLYLDFSDINDGTVKVFSDKNSNGIQRQKTIGFKGGEYYYQWYNTYSLSTNNTVIRRYYSGII